MAVGTSNYKTKFFFGLEVEARTLSCLANIFTNHQNGKDLSIVNLYFITETLSFVCLDTTIKKGLCKTMHQPGIEPGSVPWQGTILPLDHWCYE